MHGGRFGEERKRGRHMWAGISRANSIVAGDVSSSSSLSPANSFYKDGRKICVGDCALFKPPQDSPPFIGIIRVLTTDEENKLKLSINCLYRPAEVKLGKGIELEAAPNEIFYSFHKDKIPAASLLHPCKVAFLPKGVELPSGISAFVCRRVYDIDNKCLWWLTDHNYNCELQEEVDQLLHKTRLEMHASVQSGGRSPKPVNSPTSTSQLKASSDSVQNSASSLHSQGKGKKRERGDQGSEPVKRERISKVEDGDSGSFRSEGWTAEIAKFTEKGGLVDFDGVEKLLQLMLPEKSSRKVDLVGRSVMAGVVSATDKLDCLNQFVQHGLPVFDEWLQEVHKGKVSDGGDKSVEDFLLVLLRALDKLPVNLHALQMCNIGKSVNLLRSHKNSDIQKKARSLVDTWKKRVEAEMDARSGSNQAAAWPARRRLAEASHNGNRQIGVSSDVTLKSSGAHPSATKPGSFKPVHGEAMTNSAPVSAKSTPSPGSVDQPRSIDVNGTSELPVAAAREERSSSSSQSHNNSQSCSSDHGKTGGFSGKEDARSSSAGSLGNKGSSGHRKSVKGFTGSSQSVVQKDTEGSRSSPSHRNSASGRVSHSNLTTEKAADTSVVEGSNSKLIEGSNNKLIVKIPNIGRSPARSASGGSLEDPSVMNSRASSPVHSEKHEHFEHNSKPKTDTYQSNVTYDANAESWRCNDSKEVLTGSDGDGSPGTVADDEPRRAGNNSRKVAETLKATTSSTSGNEHKKAKVHDASFKSINALIESCVKYSESETFMSIGDDVGMNLLANVAAGEMSKSDVGTPVVESSGTGDSLEVKTCPDGTAQHNNQIVDSEHQKQSVAAVTSLGRSADGRTTASSQKPTGDIHEQSTSAVDVEPRPEPIADSNMKLETLETMTPVSLRAASEKASDGVGDEPWDKKVGGDSSGVDRLVDAKDRLCASAPADNKPDVSVVKSETKAIDGSLQNVSVDGQKDNKFNLSETTCTTNLKVEDKFKASEGEVSHPSISIKELVSENVDRVKSEPDVKNDGRNESAESEKTEQGGKTNLKHDTKPERMENNDNEDKLTGVPDSLKASVVEQQIRSRGSNSSGIEADETEECMSNASPVSTSVADREGKLAFDLNEGFNADEGKYGEQNIMKIPACSAAMKLVSPMPLPVLSSPNVIHAAVTVPSAAKRAYVPTEDLLKNRGELGWKGSASAFRPAEPRRAVESSAVVTNSSLSDTSISKSGRPPLDFDLNVADDTVVEDVAVRSSNQVTVPESNLANNHGQGRDQLMGSIPARKSSGFDLDLNRVEEPIEVGSQLAGNTNGLDLLSQPVKSISDGLLNGKPNNRRDFDLNDGPVVDEVSTDPSPFSQQLRSSVSFQPPSSVRMNSTEMGNFSSWFPQGSAYPSVNIQSILPDRDNSFQIVGPGGHQRMLGHPSGSTPFTPDVYRGPLLSSSPAVPFPSTTFQYPVFPIGNSFPLPSATFSGASATYVDSSPGGRLCFPAMPSQVLAPAGTVPSNYIRAPFVVGFSDSNNSGAADNNRKWGRQGFDLNTGPLAPDVGGNVELSSIASRQLSATSSQALPEEQARLYQVAGGNILKRPEPEGGWEGFKQTSWH